MGANYMRALRPFFQGLGLAALVEGALITSIVLAVPGFEKEAKEV